MRDRARRDLTILWSMLGAMMLLGSCESWFRYRDGARVEDAAEIAARDAEVRAKLDEADRARAEGDYTTALALFREILSQNPTVTTAYLGIGDIYMDQGDYATAEPNFGRAARLEPRNFDAQFKHGFALQLLERFVEAVRAYHRALTIRPNDPEANLNLGTTYLEMGELQSALTFAEKAVEVDPANGPARVNLAAIYQRLDRHVEAIDTFRVAVELTDPTAELILNLVQSLREVARYREMVEAAQTLNRMAPNANAYEAIGYGWFKLRDYEQSTAAYEKAVALDPDNWPSWNGIGCNAVNRWLLSKKEDREARRIAGDALRKSLRLNPNQQNVIQLVSTYQL